MRTSRGTIFKRGKKGYYYLRYWLNNKEIKVALKDPDGNPITRQEDAEVAAKPYRDVVQASKRAVQMRNIQEAVATADMKLQKLEEERLQEEEKRKRAAEYRNSLKIRNAWQTLVSPVNRIRPQCSSGTLHAYQCYWKVFVKWLDVNAPEIVLMRDLTPMLLNRYFGEFEEGLTAYTFNKHLRFLTWFFERLKPFSHCEDNPFQKIEKKKLQRPFRREAFTADELKIILKTAADEGGELGMLIWIGACTGLRLGDAVTLTWTNIDLRNSLIRKTTHKTDTDVVLGIPEALGRLLCNVPPEQRTGYVLPELSKKYLKRRNALAVTISDFFRRCGFDTHVKRDGLKRPGVQYGFHSLRHALATLLGDIGASEKAVQQTLGHSKIEMTRYYTHDTTKAAHCIAGNVNQLLKGILSEDGQQQLPEHKEVLTSRGRLHALVDQLGDEEVEAILQSYGKLEGESETRGGAAPPEQKIENELDKLENAE